MTHEFSHARALPRPGVANLRTGQQVRMLDAMPTKRGTRRPNDFNMMAKLIVDEATGSADAPTAAPESPAVTLGRAGGLKGGKARAAALTAKQRAEAAAVASAARWKKSR